MIELDKALENELENTDLADLEESLFERVSLYLKKLQNNAVNAQGLDNDILVAEIEDVKKKISLLFELRLEKIAESQDIHLLSDEQNIFKQLSLLKKQYRKELLEPILRGEYIFEKEGFIKAKIISQIPSFLDGELRKYGPYKPGDVDHFPEKVHAILSKHGLIE